MLMTEPTTPASTGDYHDIIVHERVQRLCRRAAGYDENGSIDHEATLAIWREALGGAPLGKRGMTYIGLTNRNDLYLLTDEEQIALLSEYQVSCAEINRAGAIDRRRNGIEVLALLRGDPRYAAAMRHYYRQCPELFEGFDEAIREELAREDRDDD